MKAKAERTNRKQRYNESALESGLYRQLRLAGHGIWGQFLNSEVV